MPCFTRGRGREVNILQNLREREFLSNANLFGFLSSILNVNVILVLPVVVYQFGHFRKYLRGYNF